MIWNWKWSGSALVHMLVNYLSCSMSWPWRLKQLTTCLAALLARTLGRCLEKKSLASTKHMTVNPNLKLFLCCLQAVTGELTCWFLFHHTHFKNSEAIAKCWCRHSHWVTRCIWWPPACRHRDTHTDKCTWLYTCKFNYYQLQLYLLRISSTSSVMSSPDEFLQARCNAV